MGHITRKLLEEVGYTRNGCEDFIERIKCYIWALDSPNDFEESWGKMLKEFSLTNNKWLHQTYDIPDFWMHDYFKENFLAGILRTTSGLESQNYIWFPKVP